MMFTVSYGLNCADYCECCLLCLNGDESPRVAATKLCCLLCLNVVSLYDCISLINGSEFIL